jgi:hypothetical protein
MEEIEFTPEFITEAALTPEQVTAINGYVAPKVAEIKTSLGSLANENTEKMIDSVIQSTQKAFGVELTREKGEKHAEYLTRLNALVLNECKANVAKLEQEYQQKLKDFQGDDATKAELQAAKDKLEAAQQKLANYDELTEKAAAAENLTTENQTLTKLVTFGAVKPVFPDVVNAYEADAKWKAAVSKIEEEWDVKLVDKVPMAINKENPFKTEKLETLIKKDEELSKLLEGRQQSGTGATETKQYEGGPFPVPVGVSVKDLATLVRNQVISEGIPLMDNKRYPARFKELMGIVKQKTAPIN